MMVLPAASFCFFFPRSIAGDYCLGSNIPNASFPKRSQQLMTWFTFHPGNCSGWKALPHPDCARLLRPGQDAAGRERSGRSWEEQGASWVSVLVAPSSCTKLLVLSRASPSPLLLCATLQLAQVLLSDVGYTLLKNTYGKDWGGTQRGWLLAPHAFSVSLFLWSCFLLVVTKC